MFEGLKKSLGNVLHKLSRTELNVSQLDSILWDFKLALLKNDVALSVTEKICDEVKNGLQGVEVKRFSKKSKIVEDNLREVIYNILRQDRRVDLVTYPVSDKWKHNYLDRQQAGLMRDSGAGYLVDVSKLLVTDAYFLRKNIEYLKRNVGIALKHDIPVVASSFAAEPLMIRDPFGLAALLSLLDVDEDDALEMVSTNPYNMVTQNRAKLNDSYIQDGVWVTEDE